MGDRELILIERLGLPKVKNELKSKCSFPRITFADNPIAVPSFAEPCNPKATRLFTSDNASSILTVEVMMWCGEQGTLQFNLTSPHVT